MPRSKRKSKGRNDAKKKEGEISQNEAETSALYVIKNSPVVGRFLEANTDLTAGQFLLKENPLVVGPSQDGPPQCIGCYSSLNVHGNIYRCTKCAFPLCSEHCSGIGKERGHSKSECLSLSRSSVKNLQAQRLIENLDVIAPLRCLILRSSNSEAWKIVSGMESHTDIRKKLPLWESNQKKVVDVIRRIFQLDEFEEDVIHNICGVLEVNAFEVGKGLRALYPTSYLFAHDCVPNIRHSDDSDFTMTFWTTVPIPKGTSLNVTYTFIIQNTLGRRKHLRDTKFFDCECVRCKDKTELGLHLGALHCPICKNGLVLSSNPLDCDADWLCCNTECPGYVISGSAVYATTQMISNELDVIHGNDVVAYEKFLLKHSRYFHERHYLCLSALHCLFQLYGKIDGWLIGSLSDEQLERKIEICQILLEVFGKLEPGLTKQRGLIYYEMQAPLMMMLQKRVQQMSKAELKRKLREIAKCLQESVKMLSVEPVGSAEFEISLAAKEALLSLRG